MEKVSFKNGNVDVAGQLYRPDGFDSHAPQPAIVCVHPGSSVKEQTAGLYAAKLAAKGFLTLTFDASYQGESGGEPRHLEDPAMRAEDIRCAVDFLTTLPYVDAERIGVLGVCAGGAYAVNAAMTERRIKAVGTVVAANGFSKGDGSPDFVEKTLAAVARARTAAARGEPQRVVPWIPNTPEERERAGLTELDLTQAVDYYRTPRGQHRRSDNQLLLRSMGPLMAFDAFHLVEKLLVQPLQIIVGSKVGAFGSYADGHELFARAPGEKDLFVIEGASHYDLYDRTEYVDQAVEKLEAFYARTLRG